MAAMRADFGTTPPRQYWKFRRSYRYTSNVTNRPTSLGKHLDRVKFWRRSKSQGRYTNHFSQESTQHIRHAMTSVNSPACLLARNHFYRKLPSPGQMKPEFSCQDDSLRHKQRELTFWVTLATPSGGIGTKGLWVNIVLSSSSLHFSTSKPTSRADRGVK